MNKSEIRKDYFLNNYSIITPGRAKRPHSVDKTPSCPFCPENIDWDNVKDKIGGKKDWQVLSLGNKFPAVSADAKFAYGYQEVIIDTPKHDRSFADMTETEIIAVLEMYAKRTKELSKDEKIEYILCFKNHGRQAGASLNHEHSQVFASEILPPDIAEELIEAQRYQEVQGACPYCDIINCETGGKRVITEDSQTIAIAPFASRYQYEAWIFSKRHVDNIGDLTTKEMKAIAKILKILAKKLKGIGMSYNLFIHQVKSNRDQHFYLKVQPRGSVWAGLELGSGLVINTVTPEKAAAFYKKK
jgi:UDPglucose--hexose-1-phosphate uridylyltransferase